MNALLQSDPQLGVPKNYKALLKLNDPKWTTSMHVTLEQEEKHDDWIQILVDVEAAFLNALVDNDVYIEFPEGLLEYLESKGIYLADHIIKLKRAQYGLVQSPRLWMMTFAKILINLGLTQCKTDPCLFTLHDPDGNLLVLVVVYCDDSIITGIRKHVDRIKKGISDAVAISDLGNLVRHLGVDYETGRDKSGKYIRSSMTDYLEAIVRDFETDVNAKVKEHKTPGAAVTPLFAQLLKTKLYFRNCTVPTSVVSCLPAASRNPLSRTHVAN
ncbi:gag-polypeptide of LTR copia-type [Fragilaria crotonensis]|nr:gag-polypeptide of LTR copia-type [Fragilaria crotonensis]